MRITDAQIHIWDAATEYHASQVGHRADGLDVILREMDSAGVDRAVIVPPNSHATEMSLDVANEYPDRFGVMAVIPLDREEAKVQIAHWESRRTGLLGVRLALPPWRPTSWLKDGTADWFWPEAERHGIPVMVWAPEQWPEIRAIAERHPDLRFIVDHLGLFVDVFDDAIGPAIRPVLELASLANVGVKVTALPCHSTEPYPFKNLHGFIEKTIEAFGADRTFWGSDLTRLPCPYRQAVTMFTEELPFLKGPDLEAVMGGSISKWLNWP